MPKEKIEQVNINKSKIEKESDQIDQLKRLRKEICDKIGAVNYYKIAHEFSLKLREEYGDKCYENPYYHILGGSTMPDKQKNETENKKEGPSEQIDYQEPEEEPEDFPGEYSVKDFLEQLYEEITEQETES